MTDEEWLERFALSIGPGDPDECWEWLRGRDRYGYGAVRRDGKTLKAHRVAYELEHGAPPVGLVLHSCDNPPCCNPAHLIDGTQKQNMADKMDRGRGSRGDTHPQRKIGSADVLAIRASREPHGVLAARYGISASHVSGIRSRRFWRHV